MAQSLDPDMRSENRSDSQSDTIFRRIFAFWRHEGDLASEVAPALPSKQRSKSGQLTQTPQAFTIWTSKTVQSAAVRGISASGRYVISEFDGFTLWSTPDAVAKSGQSKAELSRSSISSLPKTRDKLVESNAFSTWTTPDALASQADRWQLTPSGSETIQLPPSNAFTVWSLPAVREVIASRWEKPQTISLPPSQAFSSWTTLAALTSQAHQWTSTPIKLPPSEAFTLWSLPAIREVIASRWEKPQAISLPPSQAFSTWTTPAALTSQANQWTPTPIKLPPSQAFTLWSLPTIREVIAARWEKSETITLSSPQPFSSWTTPTALASQADRWPTAKIQIPPSEAFTLWSHPSILPLLADRWEPTNKPDTTSLTESPNTFKAASPEPLSNLSKRWKNEPEDPMINIKDPNPFSIWTQRAKTAILATVVTDPPKSSGTQSRATIQLAQSNAHSIWSTVEGLATAAARWIPDDASAKVEAIPTSFTSPSKRSSTRDTKEPSNITPFPSGKNDSDTEANTNFNTQNTMEDNNTDQIKLANSNAFTLWTTADKWKSNSISSTTANKEIGETPAPTEESSAPAAALASTSGDPIKSESSEGSAAAVATTTDSHSSSDGGDKSGFWKWAFILASLLGLGFVVSQGGELKKAKDEIEAEKASRMKVASQFDDATTENADLNDQLVESNANIQTLAKEKADIEAAMDKMGKELGGTIATQKDDIVAKANQLKDMESVLGTITAENEAATKKIADLAKEVEAKALSLKQATDALKTAQAQADKLQADLKTQQTTTSQLEAASKELDAKLKMSSNDKEALGKELKASTDALASSKQAATQLEKQIAELNAKIAELTKPEPAPEPAPESTPEPTE